MPAYCHLWGGCDFIYGFSDLNSCIRQSTILLSYEGRKIEEQSKVVLKLLRGLQIDYDKVNDNLDVLGKHLVNASNQYGNVNKSFLGLGQKLSTINQLGSSVEKDDQQKLIE